MAKSPTSFRSVIELWSTRKGMADELALKGPNPGADAISKWWRRDRIPDEWWLSVLATATARSHGVTADKMAALAARDLVDARTSEEVRA